MKICINKISLLIFTLLAFLLASMSSSAAPSAAANIKQKFAQHLPDIRIDKIKASPVKGLYQLNSGPFVVYATEDGRYVFEGDIIDLEKNNQNLTEDARKVYRVKRLSSVKDKDTVEFSPKKTEYTVTVFTDIDCGYCRKLHGQMQKILANNIKIKYLAFPRTGINSDSYDKAVSVWCSKDRAAALTQAKAGKAVDAAKCSSPVQQQMQLGMELGVTGTPTVLFEDGTIVPGYMPPDVLLKMAKAHTKK